MKMMFRNCGGKDAIIQPPFMVFKTQDRNYPIRGIPDEGPGASYHIGPKGWISHHVEHNTSDYSKIIS